MHHQIEFLETAQPCSWVIVKNHSTDSQITINYLPDNPPGCKYAVNWNNLRLNNDTLDFDYGRIPEEESKKIWIAKHSFATLEAASECAKRAILHTVNGGRNGTWR